MTVRMKPWEVEALLLADNWARLPTALERLQEAMGRAIRNPRLPDEESAFLAACHAAVKAEGRHVENLGWAALWEVNLEEVERAGSLMAAPPGNPLTSLWRKVWEVHRREAMAGSD